MRVAGKQMKMNESKQANSQINLYVKTGSENGMEILILLKQLGLDYTLEMVDHAEEIKDDAFRFVDIHGHLPILTDVHDGNGHRFSLQESGAIVQYLIDRYDDSHVLSYAKGSPGDLEVSNWLFFLTSRLGPNHDEAVHFSLRAPEHVPYGISRFTNETLQLYMVLERHLQQTGKHYLVDERFTIADIVHIPYIAGSKQAGIDIAQFPALQAWYDRVAQCSSVKETMEVFGKDQDSHSR
ncbi:glutathione S-transferase [Aspergillus ambiguus]|uniref:glutathione S-transferase family protein n=1 Tax=Aspergillus ambiguus TaxID=176160 RepID=UPI003CCD2FB5